MLKATKLSCMENCMWYCVVSLIYAEINTNEAEYLKLTASRYPTHLKFGAFTG